MKGLYAVRLIRSKAGMGLVEVMIALGVMSIIGLGMTTMFGDVLKGVNATKFQAEANVNVEEVRTLLSSPQVCAENFKGLALAATTDRSYDVIKDLTGQVVYDKTKYYGNNSFKIESIRIVGFDPTFSPTSGVTELKLAVSPKGSTAGAQLIPRTIRIGVTLVSGQVDTCIALAKMSDGVWQRQQGTPTNVNNIYFNSGSVGIGTSMPMNEGNNGGLTGGTYLHVHNTTNVAVVTAQVVPPNDTTPALSAFMLKNREAGGGTHIWSLYHGAAGGGWGVNPNAFEIWEYDQLSCLAPGGVCASRFKILPGGDTILGTVPSARVGVGISPVHKLDVYGDINSATGLRVAGQSVCTAAGCTPSASDRRLKKSIEPLSDSLAKILSLQGVSYHWKDGETYGKGRQVGVLAQDVEKVYPEVVTTDWVTGRKAVSYAFLVAPLIEATKSLFARLVSQESKVDELQQQVLEHARENLELKSRIEKLESLVSKIK